MCPRPRGHRAARMARHLARHRLIAHGLARQDRDLSLTRYRDRWGASVFVTGREHSVVQGSGRQTTPWEAAQQAAFQTLHRGRYWAWTS